MGKIITKTYEQFGRRLISEGVITPMTELTLVNVENSLRRSYVEAAEGTEQSPERLDLLNNVMYEAIALGTEIAKMYPHFNISELKNIDFTPTESKIVAYLYENMEGVLTPEEIEGFIYEMEGSIDPGLVRVHISTLRKKMRLNKIECLQIQTIRSRGYMLTRSIEP